MFTAKEALELLEMRYPAIMATLPSYQSQRPSGVVNNMSGVFGAVGDGNSDIQVDDGARGRELFCFTVAV